MEGHASINSITLTTWKLEDLPTHQVFSTNEPREGRVKTTASPAAPAQGHPSRHLIEHPVQVTSEERKSRETAEQDERRPGEPATGRRGKRGRPGACQIRAQTPQLSVRVVAVLGRGSHLVQKTNSHHTPFVPGAPATTSDLMQKHLHLFFKSMEEAKLPAWGHQEMADWRWGWSTCCIRPLHACLPPNSSKMGKLGSRTQVPFTAPVSSCLWSVWAPRGQRLCLASHFSPVRSRARYIRPKACWAMVSIPPISLWTGASWGQKPCLRHLYFLAPCTCTLTLNRREFTRRLSTSWLRMWISCQVGLGLHPTYDTSFMNSVRITLGQCPPLKKGIILNYIFITELLGRLHEMHTKTFIIRTRDMRSMQ